MASIKARLHARSGLVSGFLSCTPSPVVAQAIASAGADFIIIDQEHGPIGPESLHAMIAATAGTACSPWVRVAKRDDGLVKAALDAGAEGIVFPLVNTAEDAADCVAMTRYPPEGRRGWGPFVAHSRWGTALLDYAAQRGDETLCVLLIETRAAVENIASICKVEGIDCAVVAPFDLSTDLGVSGRFDAPEFIEAVQHLERHILESGVPLGGVGMSEEATKRGEERGYRVLLHGFDVLMLKQAVRQAMGWGWGSGPTAR